VLSDEFGLPSQNEPQHECDDERVVELTCDRNEVRDDVEREGEIRNQCRDKKLVAPRQAGIAEQPTEENYEVGDESRDGACIVTSACDDEREYKGDVQRNGCAESECEPRPQLDISRSRAKSFSSSRSYHHASSPDPPLPRRRR
jgi:hypothetical protein